MPLIWALVASLVVHGAFLALQLSAQGRSGGPFLPMPVLQATVVAARQVDRAAVAVTTELSSPLAMPTAAPPPPATQNPALRTSAVPDARASVTGVDGVRIHTHPLVDRHRLGDLMDRQMRDYPSEIDHPPRLVEKISVRYPPVALAERREESVAVWVAVNAQGAPDEIVVTEGSEEFASAVVAALREARFLPARNHLVPIAFPIALEFRFTLDGTASPRATAAAHRR